ncbi:hypothetical protein D9M70_513410 [compost metagenome]
MQGYVRPYQGLQAAVGTALLRGQGRFEQLLVEFLDQFEQQVLLAFEMVVQGARDYLQVLGEFAHANPREATLGKEFESLAADLLEPGARGFVRRWKSLPGDSVGGQALANQWTPSPNSGVATRNPLLGRRAMQPDKSCHALFIFNIPSLLQTRSKIAAIPWPPPMHMVAKA